MSYIELYIAEDDDCNTILHRVRSSHIPQVGEVVQITESLYCQTRYVVKEVVHKVVNDSRKDPTNEWISGKYLDVVLVCIKESHY